MEESTPASGGHAVSIEDEVRSLLRAEVQREMHPQDEMVLRTLSDADGASVSWGDLEREAGLTPGMEFHVWKLSALLRERTRWVIAHPGGDGARYALSLKEGSEPKPPTMRAITDEMAAWVLDREPPANRRIAAAMIEQARNNEGFKAYKEVAKAADVPVAVLRRLLKERLAALLETGGWYSEHFHEQPPSIRAYPRSEWERRRWCAIEVLGREPTPSMHHAANVMLRLRGKAAGPWALTEEILGREEEIASYVRFLCALGRGVLPVEHRVILEMLRAPGASVTLSDLRRMAGRDDVELLLQQLSRDHLPGTGYAVGFDAESGWLRECEQYDGAPDPLVDIAGGDAVFLVRGWAAQRAICGGDYPAVPFAVLMKAAELGERCTMPIQTLSTLAGQSSAEAAVFVERLRVLELAYGWRLQVTAGERARLFPGTEWTPARKLRRQRELDARREEDAYVPPMARRAVPPVVAPTPAPKPDPALAAPSPFRRVTPRRGKAKRIIMPPKLPPSPPSALTPEVLARELYAEYCARYAGLTADDLLKVDPVLYCRLRQESLLDQLPQELSPTEALLEGSGVSEVEGDVRAWVAELEAGTANLPSLPPSITFFGEHRLVFLTAAAEALSAGCDAKEAVLALGRRLLIRWIRRWRDKK